jgi:plastocyanin
MEIDMGRYPTLDSKTEIRRMNVMHQVVPDFRDDTLACPSRRAQPKRFGTLGLIFGLAAIVLPAGPPPAAAAPAGVVRIQNFAFMPQTLTVAPGTIVAWTNSDQIPHTSTAKNNLWDSHPIQPGATFERKFDTAGTYTYGCSIHPFMQATVVVGDGN